MWDTENDANEFFYAYANRIGKRYPDATPKPENTAAHKEWKTTSGNVLLERRGLRVVALEGLPSNSDPKTFLRSIW
jgi:hypothetical protein